MSNYIRIRACLGGWCCLRERCSHYHEPNVGQHNPVERLCDRGREKEMHFVPIRFEARLEIPVV